jgi:hypothetical protein
MKLKEHTKGFTDVAKTQKFDIKGSREEMAFQDIASP